MVFTLHDTPRRAHSIAAQGGINAAKNYKYDGDSVYRLFYDTLKGGDYRAREANVYRLAQISTQIIDHCVAIGVPFAREYGGLLDTRSFGGAQLQRTFYARGQTGQQLLLGAYSLITGEIEAYSAHAVILATGGYSNVFYLSTNAATCNVSAAWKCYKKGAGFANPCFTQIHPTCIPRSGDHQSKLTLMSESLRNDGRVWVPKIKGDTRHPNDIPEEERDYYLERMYPSFGNLVPRDIASRAAKRMVDAGYGVGPTKEAVYLDFRDAIKKQGREKIKEKYGNLFDMYYRITDEDAYSVPMRIYPAPHYTMGGLWVDYELMSTIPGLFVLGEANFSDHGANRLGASALMQGLADGYFIISATLPNYLANTKFEEIHLEDDEFKYSINEVKEKIKKILSIKGNKTPTEFHKELGKIMWEYCGMARNEEGLKKALRMVPSLKEEFMENLKIVGDDKFNQVLEKALRVYDFIEFAELLLKDALHRKESCGGHFREEYQTPDGEAKRDDENFAYVAVWEYKGDNKEPELHKEKLEFEYLKPTTRSYK
jgi:succinate dehydrogenase / fumarate reductase flavoprotein subunit